MIFNIFAAAFLGYILMKMEAISNICSFRSLKTIGTMFLHSVGTFPSLVYHSSKNKYYKYTLERKHYGQLISKNVIVFVHGRNGSDSDFIPLIDNIKSHSYLLSGNELVNNGYLHTDNVVRLNNDRLYALRTVSLGETGYTSIDEDVASLSKELQIYQNCNIILVGLSKGGVVVMRYATSTYDYRIIKVITISAPLKGTLTASLFPPSSKVAFELGYQSAITREIDEQRKNKSLQIYHVVPKWDQLIIPNTASKYDDIPDSHIYYYNGWLYSHSGIAYDPNVAKFVTQWASEHYYLSY